MTRTKREFEEQNIAEIHSRRCKTMRVNRAHHSIDVLEVKKGYCSACSAIKGKVLEKRTHSKHLNYSNFSHSTCSNHISASNECATKEASQHYKLAIGLESQQVAKLSAFQAGFVSNEYSSSSSMDEAIATTLSRYDSISSDDIVTSELEFGEKGREKIGKSRSSELTEDKVIEMQRNSDNILAQQKLIDNNNKSNGNKSHNQSGSFSETNEVKCQKSKRGQSSQLQLQRTTFCQRSKRCGGIDSDVERGETRREMDEFREVDGRNQLADGCCAKSNKETLTSESIAACVSASSKKPKSIATYLKQNYQNKEMSWQTNLIVTRAETTDDYDSDNSTESDVFEKRPKSTGICGAEQKCHNRLGYCGKAKSELAKLANASFLCSNTREQVLACATAAITANFVPIPECHPRESCEKQNECIKSVHITDGHERNSFFKYPLISNVNKGSKSSSSSSGGGGSSSGNTNKQSPSYSDAYADGTNSMSRVKLTQRQRSTKGTPRSASHRQYGSSLHFSLDNIRLLLERNLVATLIGVYILVSLTVIVVLMLPYVFSFNLPRSYTIEDVATSDELAGVSYESNVRRSKQQQHLTDHELSAKSRNEEPRQKESKATQTSQDGGTTDSQTSSDNDRFLKRWTTLDRGKAEEQHEWRIVTEVPQWKIDKEPEKWQTSMSTNVVGASNSTIDTINSSFDKKGPDILGLSSTQPLYSSSAADSSANYADERIHRDERVLPVAETSESPIGKKRGTRLSRVKSLQGVSSQKQQQQQQQQSNQQQRTSSRANDRFNGLWNVVHNQHCQALNVPFCTRSLESMFTGFTLPGQEKRSSLPMEISLATSWAPYDMTLVPNQFAHVTQSKIDSLLQKYEPIIDIKCYALMPLFLCSIYAPKCVQVSQTQVERVSSNGTHTSKPSILDKLFADLQDSSGDRNPDSDSDSGSYSDSASASNTADELSPGAGSGQFAYQLSTNIANSQFQAARKQASSSTKGGSGTRAFVGPWAKLVPPCKSLCKEAFHKCMFFFEVLSLKLLDPEDCDSLPESSDPNVCVGQQEHNLLQRAMERQVCQEDKFRCGDGECIPKNWRCDGYADCTDKSDELKCSRCNLVTQFYCGQNICISKSQVCNGIRDCQDGRDERQCLRLSHIGDPIRRTGQLEVWSAVKDSWVPVCGAHWSPQPMSHEACQALGYSRANETLILFNQTQETDSPSIGLSQDAKSSPLLGSSTSPILISPKRQTIKGSSEAAFRSPVGVASWFDVASADSYGEYSGTSAGNADSQQLAGLIEDMAAVESSNDNIRLSHAGGTDHLISYDRKTSPTATKTIATATSTATNGNSNKNNNLASIDADEVKLKSLTSMLYHGPQTGCTGRHPNSVSSVNLQCENFQCGRSVTSYSSRVKLQASDSSQSSVSSRLVVGGVESMPGEFPYLAALHGGPDEVFFCGGVLISINWLLTAAHCVGNRTQPDGWMVKVGVTRRIASPAFVKKFKIRKIIKHPNFNRDSLFNNDIALILLEESVEFNQYLRPICLPRANLKLGPDNSKDCVVAGFGKSKFSQEANYLHVAHFVNVPIVRHSVCSGWYAEHGVNLTDGMLCAGYAEGKRDACQGDSGSGLFCRYSNTNQFFVAGVVSFGIKCATPKLPGVYTSVPLYVDWIESTTREHGYPLDLSLPPALIK